MIPEFPRESMFQNYFLRQKIVFPMIWAETSGSHTNFSRRICLNGSNPLSFQRFGEIDRFFVCQSACFGRNKRIGCIHAFRIFPKDAQFDKIDLEMLFLAMDNDMHRYKIIKNNINIDKSLNLIIFCYFSNFLDIPLGVA